MAYVPCFRATPDLVPQTNSGNDLNYRVSTENLNSTDLLGGGICLPSDPALGFLHFF
jgi:hypothetical protein